MHARGELVGRDAELAQLARAVERARRGSGGLLLLAGEAGVGKTRLAEDAAAASRALVLRGTASNSATAPYGPVISALRIYLRSRPAGLDACGPLRAHLAVLLPELGAPAAASDNATIFEAIRCALEQIASAGPVLVVLDDLQWSDEATLELLAALAPALKEMAMLVVAAYRSDGLPRDHMLRRLRNELRRGPGLDELVLAPLDLDATAVLAGQLLGSPPSAALVRALHDRTQGLAFFVEELTRALVTSGGVRSGPRGVELVGGDSVPVPDTVRDAVLMSAADLSEPARAAAETLAVAGQSFDLGLLGELVTESAVAELLAHGLIRDEGGGRAAFRHALHWEAWYADVPWLRRRALHRQVAELLEAGGGPSMEIATQWLGARDAGRARELLVRAAREFEAVHAYRDATSAGRQALELWTSRDDEAVDRIDLLERHARCAERAGQLTEAAKAWRELSDIRSAGGDGLAYADAQRRLAGVHELKGEREPAFAARRLAVLAFAANDRPADAAIERLAMGDHRRSVAQFSDAVELARAAAHEAVAAGRLDLRARALGLEGLTRAQRGEFDEGLETVRTGLALALEHDLTLVAAELYQRLAMVLYHAADYRRAEEALDTALDLCRADSAGSTEIACVTCLVYVLRERGEWSRSAQLSRELIATDTAVWVAEGMLGTIRAFQGKLGSARRMLTSSLNSSTPAGHYHMWFDSTAGLAYVAAAEGAHQEATEHCWALLRRWHDSEDRHFCIWGLRWGAAYFASRGDRPGAHGCTHALTQIASTTGHPYALGALAHAIGETALLEGDADTAAGQLTRAAEIFRTLDIPFERAHVELRAGVALAAAGDLEPALERLRDAYLTARKLGARPLTAAAANEVAALGASVAQWLGGRAAADTERAGLTPRELEVLRLIAVGRTNREVAQELFLSPRTVDMHVRNMLRKLDCRSRVEAAHRGGELGLLA
ncbi:MAG TPA: AAA family ATPase [Solirubrobacteraceae bacterium]|nr:AAA family ATPase [Solirubrobacteraceae bacterium]